MRDLRTHALALCAGSTFLGAALIFAVQPLLAKHLLPWFGGSASTWAACLVFFQGMLLAGYVYAHVLARRLSRPGQLAVHGILIALAAAAAAHNCVLQAPSGRGEPPLQIALLLLSQIGATYFVLSATGPLIQRWAAPLVSGEPYALYALANAGSLLALLAYPLVLEPSADLQSQLSLWTYGFALYAALILLAMALLHAVRVAPDPESLPPSATRPGMLKRTYWVVCAFLPSVLLVAVTSHITTDIASIPLLWIVPLALYLISFIVAFSRFGRAVHAPALALFVAATLGLGLGAFAQGTASLAQQIVLPCLGLLAASVLCHGELARTRPDAEHLTAFYMVVALGGVLGSIAVSWLAPALFDDYYELELSTLGVLGLLGWRARQLSRGARRFIYLGAGICVPLLLASIAVRAQDHSAQGHVVERRRGFLGPLRVVDTREGRLLTHGRIRHGMQLRDAGSSQLLTTPTMYFAEGTAIARVLQRHASDRPRAIGIVGLGAGTLASYARPADRVRFYELDASVAELARTSFTFLADSAGHTEVAIGDGRLLLSAEPPQRFDVLVLDAFSSDAVPVHLLTREAFELYARHLAPDGVLLANVSNRHLAVDRAVRAAATSQRLTSAIFQSERDPKLHRELVRWAVMTRTPAQLDTLLGDMPRLPERNAPVLFTDTRASLFELLD